MMKIEWKREYYPNRQLVYEHPYYQGQRHGILKGWYEDGQLKYEIPWHQGQPHGICRQWCENGKLEYEEYYLYGKEVSQEEYQRHQLITQLAGIDNETETTTMS